MILWKMVCLTAIIVFVVDISGFTETWKGWLGKWLGCKVGRVRPLDCSMCASWWACVILLFCEHSVTLPYLAFAALLAALSVEIGQLIRLLRYAADTALKLMTNLFDLIWKRN